MERRIRGGRRVAGIFGGVMGQCGWGVMVEGALGVTGGEDLGYVGKGRGGG